MHIHACVLPTNIGDESLFTEARPLLDVMGKASFYLGDVGAGANMKLVVNMVCLTGGWM